MSSRALSSVGLALVLSALAPHPWAEEAQDELRQRARLIDEAEWQGMQDLVGQVESAWPLYERAFGYVFLDNIVLWSLNDGHGAGVAVEIESGHRTYLELPPGSLNLGHSVRRFQVIFMMESEQAFREFLAGGSRRRPRSALDDEGPAFHDGLAFFSKSEQAGELQPSADPAPGSGTAPQSGPADVAPRTVQGWAWQEADIPTCRPRRDGDLSKE